MVTLKIEHVTIRQLKMRMKSPFVTSFGTVQTKQFLIVEVFDKEGLVGFGEGVAFEAPWYTEETLQTSWHMLEDFLVPIILKSEIGHPSEVSQLFSSIRRNNMAKAAIETAIWDLYAKQNHISLAKALGGKRDSIEVGVSIGIQPTTEQLYEKIDHAIREGCKRIKVKIKPGLDLDLISSIRKRYPDIPLMADANSCYTLNDIPLLKSLDKYNLLMIEQPLAADDLLQHAKLQKQIQTPICLDESICSYDDAKTAIELGSCRVINIKYARVGGLTEAKKIQNLCEDNNIKVWCGGMLEAGVGRAHAIALATLSNFTLPGDTLGSSHYWEEDIIYPEVVVKNGLIEVPEGVGIGYSINQKVLEKYTVKQKIIMQD